MYHNSMNVNSNYDAVLFIDDVQEIPIPSCLKLSQ